MNEDDRIKIALSVLMVVCFSIPLFWQWDPEYATTYLVYISWLLFLAAATHFFTMIFKIIVMAAPRRVVNPLLDFVVKINLPSIPAMLAPILRIVILFSVLAFVYRGNYELEDVMHLFLFNIGSPCAIYFAYVGNMPDEWVDTYIRPA